MIFKHGDIVSYNIAGGVNW